MIKNISYTPDFWRTENKAASNLLIALYLKQQYVLQGLHAFQK